MSRKSEYQALMGKLQSILWQQAQPSTVEQAYLDQFNKTRGILNSGDYKAAVPYMNFQPLAQQQRRSSYGYAAPLPPSRYLSWRPFNTSEGGIAAAGAESPQMYQQQQDLASGQLARAYSGGLRHTFDLLQQQNFDLVTRHGGYEDIRNRRLGAGVSGVQTQMAALVGGRAPNGQILPGRPSGFWGDFGKGLLNFGAQAGMGLLSG